MHAPNELLITKVPLAVVLMILAHQYSCTTL